MSQHSKKLSFQWYYKIENVLFIYFLCEKSDNFSDWKLGLLLSFFSNHSRHWALLKLKMSCFVWVDNKCTNSIYANEKFKKKIFWFNYANGHKYEIFLRQFCRWLQVFRIHNILVTHYQQLFSQCRWNKTNLLEFYVTFVDEEVTLLLCFPIIFFSRDKYGGFFINIDML